MVFVPTDPTDLTKHPKVKIYGKSLSPFILSLTGRYILMFETKHDKKRMKINKSPPPRTAADNFYVLLN